MTDLDHHEAIIDARARGAAIGLRAAVERREMPARPAVRRSVGVGPARGWRIAMLAACVVVALAGLAAVAVVRRGADTVVRTPGGDPYWVVDGLHDGWTVEQFAPTSAAGDPDVQVTMAIFAATTAPPGAVVGLFHVVDAQGDGIGRGGLGLTNLVERQAGDRRLVLGDAGVGHRNGRVEVDGRWLQIASQDASDDLITMLAAAVVIAGDGTPIVPPDRLPPGIDALASGSDRSIAPAVQAAIGSGSPSAFGVRWSRQGSDGVDTVALASARTPSAVELAYLSLIERGRLTPVTLGDGRGWTVRVGHGPDGQPDEPPEAIVVWELDGTTFALDVRGAAAGDPVALARTVREARVQDLSDVGTIGQGAVTTAAAPATEATLAPTTAVSLTPAAPRPGTSVLGPIVIFDITRIEHTADEVQLTARAPNGSTASWVVAVVADGLIVTNPDGSGFQSNALPTDRSPTLFGSGCVAYTIDPSARSIQRVGPDGTRYRASLTSTTHHPEVRFGVLPLNAAGVDCAVLDADGNVLATG